MSRGLVVQRGGISHLYLGNWATNVPVPAATSSFVPFHPTRVQRPPQLLRANPGLCKALPADGTVPAALGVPSGTGTRSSAVALRGGDISCWAVSRRTVAPVPGSVSMRKAEVFLCPGCGDAPGGAPCASRPGGRDRAVLLAWGDIPSSSPAAADPKARGTRAGLQFDQFRWPGVGNLLLEQVRISPGRSSCWQELLTLRAAELRNCQR